MPCRSGSPQGVFGAGVWADVAATEAEMAAPNAAAATATVTIEPEKGSRMMVLHYLQLQPWQRIGFKPKRLCCPRFPGPRPLLQANSSVAVHGQQQAKPLGSQ